ncbi:hypothetical protein ACFFSH_10395 [Streptomyces filamentosus]|uniref:Integral membrane protein n=1 Tax=Streptomyces filamentosus TaxID=67294 RepID=A0A919EK25_STRFL|nr:hypothetical protein [Streptomyces filamentosus]KAA6219214.1 hypothetical protein CP979_21755 [Streptomyces filamentosus]GHF88795.1 hypothetical protein GCM10017667_16940 [Streptomyces filamentosus]
MDRIFRRKASLSAAGLLTALVAIAAWAAWMGWDQERDVHPDGSETGPYETWQGVGLVLTLLLPVAWTAVRGHGRAGAVGTSAGLTIAAFYDWSDDASGLYAVGTFMLAAGSLAATMAVQALVTAWSDRRALRRRARRHRPTS